MDKTKEYIYLSVLLHVVKIFRRYADADGNDSKINDLIKSLTDTNDLPNEKLESIIEEASCLSLGLKTEKIDDYFCLNGSDERNNLIPLTDFVLRGNDSHYDNMWQQKPCVLSIEKDAINYNEPGVSKKDYENLWNSFVSDLSLIIPDNRKNYAETLLNLLYKYTSNIPVTQRGYTDVSLYDFVKSAAAIATCLYEVDKHNENEEEPFLLIGADISGIQNYIYKISSKAAKNLKGRSFYLRLLTDSVVRYMLKELELFQANVIYNSGGGFYILAPNTSEIKDRLEKAIKTIEQKIYEAHDMSLFLAIDSIGISKKDLSYNGARSLCDIWGDLFNKKEIKKNAKIKNIISGNYSKFFEPFMTEGNGVVDVCTGELFRQSETLLKEDDIYPIKQITKDQIKLGQVLKNCELMIVSEKELTEVNDNTHINPASLGIYYYFIQSNKTDVLNTLLEKIGDSITIVLFNKFKINGIKHKANITYKFEFYGGNETVTSMFEDLCKESPKDSFKRLGILRMDVDNLGNIFQHGLSPERSTISRMSALSRSFDYFFSGYLNTIWKGTDKEHSNIIYSGGDDLFIVGDWSVMITMAKTIHDDFKRFTCQNPAFSISGGIALVEEKFPILNGAEFSAQEESIAKEHICNGASKNSISIFGMAMNFDEEYPHIESLKNDLVGLIKSEALPKSFISKILTHWSNAQIKNHEITNIKTYWMLTYDLGRMKSRIKGVEAKNIIENCKSDICGNMHKLNSKAINTSYHSLELWALACRWTELETKTI